MTGWHVKSAVNRESGAHSKRKMERVPIRLEMLISKRHPHSSGSITHLMKHADPLPSLLDDLLMNAVALGRYTSNYPS